MKETVFEKAKKLGYLGLTKKEQKVVDSKIASLIQKNESRTSGPLYVNLTIKEYDEFWEKDVQVSFNYCNSTMQKASDNTYYAKWYTYSAAEKIAKKMEKELIEC